MASRSSWARIGLATSLLACACEDPPRAAPIIDASASLAPLPTPVREGCARSGSLEATETDPSCIVKQVTEDAVRAPLSRVSITLDAEPAEAVAGGTSLLTLTIKNTSSTEVTVFLEARSRQPGPRTDWSRVAGIPEPRAAAEMAHLLFPVTTSDSDGRDVDALPTVAGSTPVAVSTLLAVHLRPGAKLTRSASWWALRIPAPAPIVTDDAGHRYVPKTTALALMPGEYTVTLELPLPLLGREERRVSTRVRVKRPPLMDGGVRSSF